MKFSFHFCILQISRIVFCFVWFGFFSNSSLLKYNLQKASSVLSVQFNVCNHYQNNGKKNFQDEKTWTIIDVTELGAQCGKLWGLKTPGAPSIQGWINIWKLSNGIHHINKLKLHYHINRCRKSIWQNPTTIHDKNSVS